MKKIYYSILSLLVITGLSAQVNVTYQVDITDYLAAGNELGANGMRVGGTFGTLGGSNAGTAMMDWNPGDAGSAMTDMGNNIWSVTVEYPGSSVGMEQLFKYVNNDWGTNEGTDTTLIADDMCGLDDGSGNINRTFIIPDADATLLYCYDACFQCDGSDPLITSIFELEIVNDVIVAPNPTDGITRISYNLDQQTNVQIRLLNVLGSEVQEIASGSQSVGNYVFDLDMTELQSGIYLYQIQAGTQLLTGKLIKR